MSKECPFCKSVVPDEANFCMHCCNVISEQPFGDAPPAAGKRVSGIDKIKVSLLSKKYHIQDFIHFRRYKRFFPVLGMLSVTLVICLLVAANPTDRSNIKTDSENVTVTVPVTNSYGEHVTDDNGENVYEVVEITTESKGFFASLFSSDETGDSNENDNGSSLFDKIFHQNRDSDEQTESGVTTSEASSASSESGNTESTAAAQQSSVSEPETTTDSNEQSTQQSQSVSEGLVWTESDGKLTITGYNGSSSVVTIPAYINGKRVSYLAQNAFSDNSNIQKIIFQGSSDGSEEFYLPYGIAVFNNLPNLTSVTFPYETDICMIKDDGSLVKLYTFYILFTDCPKLSRVDFTEYTNSNYGTSREQFLISENGVILGQDTLNDSRYRSIVYYPMGKTEKSYSVPSSCSDIGQYSFWGNPYLETLTFSEKVRYIGGPNFCGCNNLSSFAVNSANAKYRSENGVIYGGSVSVNSVQYTGVFYPPGKTDTYFELSNTTPIVLDKNSFCGNSYLQTVRCPNDSYIYTADIKKSECGAKALKSIQISSNHSYRISDSKVFSIEYYE